MRMSFRNLIKIHETKLGSFLPDARATTGLPLDSIGGWEFPNMHGEITRGLRDEIMMKINTLQKISNIIKSLVSYKIDNPNKSEINTGRSTIYLDYEFDPPLNRASSQNSKILGIRKKEIISSGLRTHGLQINPAEMGWLEKMNIIRTNPYDQERCDINCKNLFNVMIEYQGKLKIGHGLDKTADTAIKLMQMGGKGKLQLRRSAD